MPATELRVYMQKGYLISLQVTHFYRWGIWVFDRVSNLPKDIQLWNQWARIPIVQVFSIFPFFDQRAKQRVWAVGRGFWSSFKHGLCISAFFFIHSLARVSEGGWNQRETVWQLKRNFQNYSSTVKGIYGSRQHFLKSLLFIYLPHPPVFPVFSLLLTSREKYSPKLLPRPLLFSVLWEKLG